MCIYKDLEQILSSNFTDSASNNNSDFRWTPIAFPPCDEQRCPERRQVLHYFAKYLHKTIMPSICPETIKPIPEANHPGKYSHFCEAFRIIEDPMIERSQKIKLISVPSRRRIAEFVANFVECCNVDTEVIVYAIILMKRLLKTTGWTLRASSWRSIVITAFRLAQKVEEGPVVPLADLHYIYPIFTPADFVKLENTFMKMIDYRLVVSYEQFFAQYKRIVAKKM